MPLIPTLLTAAWRVFAVLSLSLTLHASASAAERIAAGRLQQEPIAFTFAVYLTDKPSHSHALHALRERMKTASMPALVATLSDKPGTPRVTAKLIATVQKTYQPPPPEQLQHFGRGLSREQADALQQTEHALLLSFAHPAAGSMPAYHAALQLAEQVARDTRGLLWDEETREVFTPDEWRKRRLDSWWNGIPDAAKQTVIHAYKGDRQVRAITLGMAKFGMPDIVVEDFAWSANRSMGNLINSLAQAMVEGAELKSIGNYDLDLRAVRHARVKDEMVSTLLPNSTGTARLVLVKGRAEAGDPDNRLMEVSFERYPGPDHYSRQTALVTALFGSQETVSRVKHNQELLDASAAARARLPALRNAFRKGLAPGEFILVKLPFDTPRGGREWMWVEVTHWEGDTITGLLNNEPAEIPTLHAGQAVKGSQAKAFDYLRRFADGREEGNETGRILQRTGR
jgi:uncharacterized protein YegJ (DUF2314 family)